MLKISILDMSLKIINSRLQPYLPRANELTHGTHFGEILIKIYIFSFKEMHSKISSGNWWPFCLGLNEMNNHYLIQYSQELVRPRNSHVALGWLATHNRWKWLWISHPVVDHKVALVPEAPKRARAMWPVPLTPDNSLLSLLHAPSAPPMSVVNHWPVAEIVLPSTFSG